MSPVRAEFARKHFSCAKRCMRAIASGVLGAASFQDGTPASLGGGLGLRRAMSLLIAGIYVTAASRWGPLRRQSIGAGIASGLGISVVMNDAVVALSPAPFPPAQQMLESLLAMILLGLLIPAATRLAGVGGTARRTAPGT